MQRVLVFGAALLAIALGALVAARIQRQEPTGEVRAAPTSSPKAAAAVATDPRGFVGVIFPRQQVDLAPSVAARVMDVKVQLGSKLKKGEVVASLDADSLRRELAAASAVVRAAQAEARSARVESDAARERAERYAKHAEAIAGDERIQAANQQKLTATRVGAASARVSEAVARVEQLKLLVENSAIVAPFDGVIAARFVDPGALVQPGQAIARLISGEDLWVRFAVPEEQAGAVAVKGCVQVTVESQPVAARGVVEMVAPQVDTELRMLVVEAQLALPPEWKERLQAGLSARVQSATCITP
jgi:RND family efflux transporter MFP subunit